jgi:hypothetical protein
MMVRGMEDGEKSEVESGGKASREILTFLKPSRPLMTNSILSRT